MGILKRAGDLIYTFRFLKLLTTSFEKTDAYAKGIIDRKGNRIPGDLTSDMKNSYTPFHRLVFNLKKLMAKAPGGSSTLASYVAALYLIKENYDIDLDMILERTNINKNSLREGNSAWFKLDDGTIAPGLYRVQYEKLLNNTCEALVKSGDKIRIAEDCSPVGNIFGVDVYSATHIKTNQEIYVTIGELTK